MSADSLLFFSSRRRHTRCLSDWSSDVCSSDLEDTRLPDAVAGATIVDVERFHFEPLLNIRSHVPTSLPERLRSGTEPARHSTEIGRASCRESVELRCGLVRIRK